MTSHPPGGCRSIWVVSRLQQWIRPRSLLLHVAFVVVAGGCLIAGWWQIHRAMQGNALSYLYSVEWPVFAIIAGIGWWQLVHDTPEFIAERKAFHARMRAASATVAARTLPASARAISVGSKEIDNGRVLAEAHDRATRSAAAAIEVTSESPAGSTELVGVPRGTPERGGGPGDFGHDADGEQPVDDEEGVLAYRDRVAEYNRYLARLAVQGKAKTWRNPRGF